MSLKEKLALWKTPSGKLIRLTEVMISVAKGITYTEWAVCESCNEHFPIIENEIRVNSERIDTCIYCKHEKERIRNERPKMETS